jgi:hypothetical protein
MRPSEYAKKHCKNQKELIEVLSRVVDYVGLLPEIRWVVECKEKERSKPRKARNRSRMVYDKQIY